MLQFHLTLYARNYKCCNWIAMHADFFQQLTRILFALVLSLFLLRVRIFLSLPYALWYSCASELDPRALLSLSRRSKTYSPSGDGSDCYPGGSAAGESPAWDQLAWAVPLPPLSDPSRAHRIHPGPAPGWHSGLGVPQPARILGDFVRCSVPKAMRRLDPQRMFSYRALETKTKHLPKGKRPCLFSFCVGGPEVSTCSLASSISCLTCRAYEICWDMQQYQRSFERRHLWLRNIWSGKGTMKFYNMAPCAWFSFHYA